MKKKPTFFTLAITIATFWVIGFAILHIACWHMGNYQSLFVDYAITSEIDHNGYPGDTDRPAAVCLVWHDGKIIEAFYKDIKNDSTMIQVQAKAESYVKMLKANKP